MTGQGSSGDSLSQNHVAGRRSSGAQHFRQRLRRTILGEQSISDAPGAVLHTRDLAYMRPCTCGMPHTYT